MVWHLYGVAELSGPALSTEPGAPAHGAEFPCGVSAPPPGIGGAPVEFVEWEGLVVAASPLQRPIDRPTPHDLACHAGLACWLLTNGATVLPFRFGVAAPGRAEVVELIRYNEPAVRAELHRMQGKVEAAVVAFWDRQAVVRELLKHPVARRWLAPGGGAPRTAPALVRARIGELTEQVAHAWRQRYGDLVRRTLAGQVLQLREREPIGVRMLLNFAALIPAGAEGSLRTAVEHLEARIQRRIRFRVTAPLPPFVFTELRLAPPGGDAGAEGEPRRPDGHRDARNGDELWPS